MNELNEKVVCPRCEAECGKEDNYCHECGEKINETFEQYTKKSIAIFRQYINTHSNTVSSIYEEIDHIRNFKGIVISLSIAVVTLGIVVIIHLLG